MAPGDIRIYSIIADVEEEQASDYSLFVNSNPSVIAVAPESQSTFSFGPFFLQGLAKGQADVSFDWGYTPNNASGFCFTHVTVTPLAFLTAANYPYSAYAGDPGNLYTGEATLDESPDLNLAGPGQLEFRRYYASGLNANLLMQSSLGINWSHNFDTRLARVGDRVDVVTYQGLKLQFQKSGSAWQPLNGQARPFQLLENGTNLILGDRRQSRIYTFGALGELIAISDTLGNTLTLSYSNNVLTTVSDGLGRSLNFSYAGFQQLASVDDGTRTVAFFYDGRGPLLTLVKDAAGGLTTYGYDTSRLQSGFLVSKTRPKGNTPLRQTFDAQGRLVTQVQLRSTNLISYAGGSSIVTDPLGHVSTYVHNTNGQLVSYTDASNATVNIGYTASGQRSGVTDRAGHTTGIAFDASSGKPSAITNAEGTVERFSYSEFNVAGITFHALSQVTYGDGSSQQFILDSREQVIARIDPNGNQWQYTYNSRGQLLTASNPLGGTSVLTYNPDGTLASTADSDLGRTTYFYDELKRLIQVVHPDGGIVSAIYDAMDRVTSVSDAMTNVYKFVFDANGNLVLEIDPKLYETRMTYDELDRLVTRTDRRGYTHSVSYDLAQHVSGVTNRNGDSVAFTYDDRGRLARMTDAEGYAWDFAVDNEGQITGMTDPMGRHVSVALGATGRVTGWTNGGGDSSLVLRDAANRVIQYVDELGRTNSFTYDAAGRLASLTRPVVGTARVRRNALGLVEEFQDFNGKRSYFGYTRMGRLISYDDPVRIELGNTGYVETLTSEQVRMTATRDFNGLLSVARYSDGTVLSNKFDELGRLVQANNVQITYDPEGHPTNTDVLGINCGATFSPAGQLSGATFDNGALRVDYSFNKNGKPIGVTDRWGFGSLHATPNPAGQLTGLDRGNGLNSRFDYAPDTGWPTRFREGSLTDMELLPDPVNRTFQKRYTGTVPLPMTFNLGSSSWPLDPNGRINSPGFVYGQFGALQSTPSHTFSLNGPGQLLQVDGIRYGYNGLGSQISRTAGGTTTLFAYNYAFPQPFVGTVDGETKQFLEYYVRMPGGVPGYVINESTRSVSYYHLDPWRMTHFLSDASGVPTDIYQYNPLGSTIHFGNSSQLLGWGASAGLHYDFGAKFAFSDNGQVAYDSDIGRTIKPKLDWNLNASFSYGSYLSAGNLTYKSGLRLTETPYEAYSGGTDYHPGTYSIGGQFKTPRIADFNFGDFVELNSPQDKYRAHLPVDTEIGIRLDPRLVKYFRSLTYDDCCCCCYCCCCCCCCCCCDCCCGSAPSLFSEINLSRFVKGYTYTPGRFLIGVANAARAEAFEKFVLGNYRMVLGDLLPVAGQRQMLPGLRQNHPGSRLFYEFAAPPSPRNEGRSELNFFRPSLRERL